MADTYIATRDFKVGDKQFKRGDVVSWPSIGSTGVLKRLMSRRVVKRVRAK